VQIQQPVQLQSTSLLGVCYLLKCLQRQTVRPNSLLCDTGHQAAVSVKESNEERDKSMVLKDGLALAPNRPIYVNVPTGQRIVTRSVSQRKYNAVSTVMSAVLVVSACMLGIVNVDIPLCGSSTRSFLPSNSCTATYLYVVASSVRSDNRVPAID